MKQKILLGLLIFPYIIYGQISGYQHQNIDGFDVYIEQYALNNHQQETNEAIDLLSLKLQEINDLGLESEIRDSLQAVKIFMDWNTTTGGAVYHPNLQWLMNNGYIPEKWKSVEISNIINFINWTELNQPFIVMHELAHAYHDRVLGYGYIPITAAYDNAMANDLYDLVSYHAGNGNYFNQEAYATTNHIEYFAELTEAYLGENDFFPFVREELEGHDSLGYNVVADVWQFETTNVNNLSESSFLVFPNPVYKELNIEMKHLNQSGLIRIVTIDGKIISQFEINSQKRINIDLSDLTPGMYLLNMEGENHKIIKM